MTTPPTDDLRTRILVAIARILTDSSGRLAPAHIAETGAAVRDTRDAVLAVVQPELDAARRSARASEESATILQQQIDAQAAELDRQVAEIQRLTAELETAQADACAYRYLADGISDTMADQNEWDGDDAEEEILLRYVRHLAVNQRPEAAR